MGAKFAFLVQTVRNGSLAPSAPLGCPCGADALGSTSPVSRRFVPKDPVLDCSVPVVPDVTVPAISSPAGVGVGADSDLAATGLHVDVLVLCVIAGVLLSVGVVALVRSRRRSRDEGGPRRRGRGKAVGAVIGLMLLLSFAAPAPGAHAAVRSECTAVQVSVVSIEPAPSGSGSLVMLPGASPVTVKAKVTNVTNASVSLYVLSSTDPSAGLASQVTWTAQRPGASVSSILTSVDAHPLGALAAGETTEVTFTLSLPASVGNEFQGQSAAASLFVRVVQQGP